MHQYVRALASKTCLKLTLPFRTGHGLPRRSAFARCARARPTRAWPELPAAAPLLLVWLVAAAAGAPPRAAVPLGDHHARDVVLGRVDRDARRRHSGCGGAAGSGTWLAARCGACEAGLGRPCDACRGPIQQQRARRRAGCASQAGLITLYPMLHSSLSVAIIPPLVNVVRVIALSGRNKWRRATPRGSRGIVSLALA